MIAIYKNNLVCLNLGRSHKHSNKINHTEWVLQVQMESEYLFKG